MRNIDCVPFQTSGGTATAQVVHTQQRTAAAPAASTELVTLASTQGVRAVTSVTASAVVTTNLTPVQTQTRSLVTQVTPGNNCVFKDFFQGYIKGPRNSVGCLTAIAPQYGKSGFVGSTIKQCYVF